MIPITWYLTLATMLFVVGAMGFFLKRNIIALLLSIEIMLNAVNLSFVAFSAMWGAVGGQVFVFFTMVVAAAEAAVGLAIVIAYYRLRFSVQSDEADALRH